jgi:hypothetical protein
MPGVQSAGRPAIRKPAPDVNTTSEERRALARAQYKLNVEGGLEAEATAVS